MVQKFGKKRVVTIAGIILAIVIVVLAIAALVNSLSSGKEDPYKQVETTNTPATEETSDDDAGTMPDDSTAETNTDDEKDESTVDPATLSTVNIDPMSITVSYVKGIPGFEFFVLRTSSGTQYVEFSSPELVGTKCTDDKGVFASIIEDPSDADSSTLSKTTTVDGVKYGLSLADATCTKDADLLKSFQSSFSDGFSALKKME